MDTLQFAPAVDRVLNAPLFTIARTPVTLLTLLMLVAILIATMLISRLAGRATHRALSLRGMRDAGSIAVIARLVRYIVLAIGFGIALQTMGIDIAALFAAGAFFAIVVGLALQGVAENFVAGFLLLAERAIKPGDVLEVEGRVVRVSRLGMRATVARSRDEEDLIIPNSKLAQNTVTNYTLRDSVYRLKTTVGVSYGSDVARVFETLRAAAKDVSWKLPDRDSRVLLLEFGSSSVVFEVSIWIQDPWQARIALSDLNEAIWWALQRADITIAFPQLDVHFDRQVVQAMARDARTDRSS